MIVAASQTLYYAVAHPLARWFLRYEIRIHPAAAATGRPVILASNHASRLDPFLLVLLPLSLVRRIGPFHFLTSEIEYRIPWQRPFLRLLGSYPIPRVAWTMEEYLGESVRRLRRGETIMMFPEGRIRRAGIEVEAKPGVAALARATGVPVLPLRIEWTGPRSVTMTFGEPIAVPTGDGRDDRTVAGEILRRIDAL